jgi:hypothetical protein
MEDEQVGRHVGKGGALASPAPDERGMQVMDRLRTKRLELVQHAIVFAVVVDGLDRKGVAFEGLRGGLPGSQDRDDEGRSNQAQRGKQRVLLPDDAHRVREPWHGGLLSVSEWRVPHHGRGHP